MDLNDVGVILTLFFTRKVKALTYSIFTFGLKDVKNILFYFMNNRFSHIRTQSPMFKKVHWPETTFDTAFRPFGLVHDEA